MKTTEEIMDLLKENPTWDAANEVAKFIFPGFAIAKGGNSR